LNRKENLMVSKREVALEGAPKQRPAASSGESSEAGRKGALAGAEHCGDNAVPDPAQTALSIVIVVTPRKASLFEARVDGVLLCTSRQPFCDAARVLLGQGLPSDTDLILRHEGSPTHCLKAKLGTAAGLTVDESGPRLRPWKAMPPLEGSPPAAFCVEPVVQVPPELGAPLGAPPGGTGSGAAWHCMCECPRNPFGSCSRPSPKPADDEHLVGCFCRVEAAQ
jgi:hypothetical protein